MAFTPVSPQVDFPTLEKDLLNHWSATGLVNKYLHKNRTKRKKFSFLDGPITANNPMGVHHAWGRTYKDLWQRYHTMKGEAVRFQNGFDCQGLWVEVEVEKELGFKSKKDIETYGIAKFVEQCKARVLKYSAIQTDQSQRLGYFMDWANSYFTMSDANNYAIWGFLKTVWQKGWLYKGHDSVPWCPRCETAISQHEMLTEDYKEVVHESVYLKLPITDKVHEYLLIWTTTPWTIPGNIAVAVDPSLDYSRLEQDGSSYWVAHNLAAKIFGPNAKPLETVPGIKLVGLRYTAPYDSLPAVQKIASHHGFHTVIATDRLIMPVTVEEGTGLVHTAVSAGVEDFKLGQKLNLPMVPLIADNADYLHGLGELSGKNAKKHPELILNFLRSGNWCFKTEHYSHRYPSCWRCKTELVWKVADEWYIAMDRSDLSHPKKYTYRRQMQSVAKKIHWLPDFGLARELDWLRNMHDWLISKKNRYWGLALPIWVCKKCHHFEVIGSKLELQNRAISGWDKFSGHTPHRPFIDEVVIACSLCQSPSTRIADVGNPWLDAGIVPFSTLPADWFPADFITESFPGQFKNWFYSMIAMSTTLSGRPPFKTVLGFASLTDNQGQVMHKSAGNMIEFNTGADQIGVDVMRWMFATHNPTDNLLFGYKKADETRRRFHLILWNTYNFFVTYANADGFKPRPLTAIKSQLAILDRWILARLSQTVSAVTQSLNQYDAYTSSHLIEALVSDFSLWYVRRSRDRVGPTAPATEDKQTTHIVLHHVLITLAKLLAPFTPFISEAIYTNLTGAASVHLASWPKSSKLTDTDLKLIVDMHQVRLVVEQGLAKRKEASIKVPQPLRSITVFGLHLDPHLTNLLKDELNVKQVSYHPADSLSVNFDLALDDQLVAEGELRELIRQVQELRKTQGARLDQAIILTLDHLPSAELLPQLQAKTLATEIRSGNQLAIELI